MPRELEGRYGFEVNPYAVTPEHVMCRAYTPTGGSTVSNAPGTATVALAPNGMNEAYANDSFGNLTQYGSFLPTYNANNQNNNWAYDAAGNLLQTGTAALTWDAESRLTSAGGASYLYDAFDERVESNGISDTGTVYFGGRPIARYSGGQWTDLIYGPNGLIAEVAGSENAEPQYRVVDPLGTLVGTMASNQLLTNPMDYTPFGQVFSGATNDPYFFTGKERDIESGLDYFGARYYGSNMGRWMSPDWADKPEAVPYSTLGNPQSLNLYGYVLNNPMSNADPDGHCCEWAKQQIAQGQKWAGDHPRTMMASKAVGTGLATAAVVTAVVLSAPVSVPATLLAGAAMMGAAGGTVATVTLATGAITGDTKGINAAAEAVQTVSNSVGLAVTVGSGSLEMGSKAAAVSDLVTGGKDALTHVDKDVAAAGKLASGLIHAGGALTAGSAVQTLTFRPEKKEPEQK